MNRYSVKLINVRNLCIAKFFLLTAYLLLSSMSVRAITMPAKDPSLPLKLQQAIQKINLESYVVRPQLVEIPQGFVAESMVPGWSSFESRYGGEWRMELDSRLKAPLLLEGKGIPLVPGNGNNLTKSAIVQPGTAANDSFSLAEISRLVQQFLQQNKGLLLTEPNNLLLDNKLSKGFGKRNRYWSLRYQYVLKDSTLGNIPVRGAYVFARISHGNLIQFGNQFAVMPENIDTKGIISEKVAVTNGLNLMENPVNKVIGNVVVDVGQQDKSLQVVPLNAPDGTLKHKLVRSFLIETTDLSVELWFDAHSGELVNAINRRLNVSGTVKGGIYPVSNLDPEVIRGLPYVNVDNNGSKAANLAGVFNYSTENTSATGSIEGPYVKINDKCGDSALSNSSSPGDLDFGKSEGTDCQTPGIGGSGNTHAARSAYYHLNLAKEKARLFLNQPQESTSWLDKKLLVTVNIDKTCNASYNPGLGTVNFFKSGGGCSNTGELAPVFLHEYGHALDDNTNGTPPEQGSGEAYGDTMAFLQTHDSCLGNNFIPGTACRLGCDETCTGVRDVSVRPEVSPATIEEAPADCDRWACPFRQSRIFPYQGPMGYEGHCESLIASGAVWDMVQGFVGRYGNGAGWALGDRIWYESLYQTGSAYQVVSGGKCNTVATVDGCGADNWYTVFLALDDDNGDLTDGTPNADLIWDAFNKHGIACGASAPTTHTTCPQLTAPSGLSVTAPTGSDVDGKVDLSWQPVTNAAGYRVYRNPFSCDSGALPIAEVASNTTHFTDHIVTGGTEYFYSLQAIGTDDICVSSFSDCQSAIPERSGAVESGGAFNLSLVLDPDKTLSIDETVIARVTVKKGTVPQSEVTVAFSSSNPETASVSASSAITDANGSAEITVIGLARGNAEIRAMAIGNLKAVKTVKVPDLSLLGLFITVAILVFFMLIRERITRNNRNLER